MSNTNRDGRTVTSHPDDLTARELRNMRRASNMGDVDYDDNGLRNAEKEEIQKPGSRSPNHNIDKELLTSEDQETKDLLGRYEQMETLGQHREVRDMIRQHVYHVEEEVDHFNRFQRAYEHPNASNRVKLLLLPLMRHSEHKERRHRILARENVNAMDKQTKMDYSEHEKRIRERLAQTQNAPPPVMEDEEDDDKE